VSATSLRRSLAALTALASLALAAPTAQAGVLVASDPDCAAQDLSQPFLPWTDVANYQLGPAGTFESGADGWQLSGASVGKGNEDFFVHGQGEKRSLSLPAGASATSATVCVGIEHPTIRFFARTSSVSATSSLKVEVLFEDALGNVHSATMGAVTPSADWAPSAPLPIVVNLLALLPGDHTPVQFRLTPVGGGDWAVDDFYVDPYRRY
jgi:hypothetical protein